LTPWGQAEFPKADTYSIVSDRGEPASVLDVKAGDEALVYLENMPDGLIEKHAASSGNNC
jgi:3-dehydroquinate synthase class II